MSQARLSYLQHGKEATAGTAVPATFKWFGGGTFEFNDNIAAPGFEYSHGHLGGIIETAFLTECGSTLTLSDTDLSAERMIWLCNMAIKALNGPATTFDFTFPVTSPNSINTFTWEVVTAAQTYRFAYGFCSSFNVHGNVGDDNGRLKLNAVIEGRRAFSATPTAGLGFLANDEPLNINNATIHFDSPGTAAGSAAPRTGFLKAFSIDVTTGWSAEASRFADGRADRDFSILTFTNYEITGTLRALFNSNAVSELANARAGTARIIAIKCNGSGGRLVQFSLPIIFTKSPTLLREEKELHVVEFSFRSGYSITSVAQAPSIKCTTVADTTVT